MRQLLAGILSMAAIGMAGCHSPTQYTSPRVTGRVLDAQSRQPISDVRVAWREYTSTPSGEPAKGGEQLAKTPIERTDSDGQFAIPSVRDLVFFRSVGWYGGALTFSHGQYEPHSKSFSMTNLVNSPAGEPTISAGEILLTPRDSHRP